MPKSLTRLVAALLIGLAAPTAAHDTHVESSSVVSESLTASGSVETPMVLSPADLEGFPAQQKGELEVICQNGANRGKKENLRGVRFKNILERAGLAAARLRDFRRMASSPRPPMPTKLSSPGPKSSTPRPATASSSASRRTASPGQRGGPDRLDLHPGHPDRTAQRQMAERDRRSPGRRMSKTPAGVGASVLRRRLPPTNTRQAQPSGSGSGGAATPGTVPEKAPVAPPGGAYGSAGAACVPALTFGTSRISYRLSQSLPPTRSRPSRRS